MYQAKSQNPLSLLQAPLGDPVRQAMWRLFVQIGIFWRNVADASEYQTRFFSFLQNRIDLNPLYRGYYEMAASEIDALIAELGEEEAYRKLFTDAGANQAPPTTPLQVARQLVSNEFVALQLAMGGFKAFGAENYCGYFGGANVPGAPVPYRAMDADHDG